MTQRSRVAEVETCAGRVGPAPASLESFLYALHTSESIAAVQSVFIGFAGRLLKASAYGIYHFSPGTLEPSDVRTRGVSDEYLDRYESAGRACDPLLERVVEHRRAFSSDLDLSATGWRGSPLYEVNRFGGIARAVQAPVVASGELVGTLNVARSDGEPAFAGRDVELVELLSRHISAAVARVLRTSKLGDYCAVLECALDILNTPLVVGSLDGTLLFANRSADRLLHESDSTTAAFNEALRANAAELAGERRRIAVAFVATPDTPPSAFPQPKRAGGERTGLTVRSVAIGGRGATVSFVYEAPAAIAAPPEILSPREREIVELVTRGLSNTEIAAAASISPNTVKQHLKRVFRKLQVGTRVELAAAVSRADAGLAMPFAPAAPPSPDGAADGRASAAPAPARSAAPRA
jgi:DNA-binding CsgD family transcriptional regulator